MDLSQPIRWFVRQMDELRELQSRERDLRREWLLIHLAALAKMHLIRRTAKYSGARVVDLACVLPPVVNRVQLAQRTGVDGRYRTEVTEPEIPATLAHAHSSYATRRANAKSNGAPGPEGNAEAQARISFS